MNWNQYYLLYQFRSQICTCFSHLKKEDNHGARSGNNYITPLHAGTVDKWTILPAVHPYYDQWRDQWNGMTLTLQT